MVAKKAIALFFAMCCIFLLSLLAGHFYGAPIGFQIIAVPQNAAAGEAEYEIAFSFTLYLILVCLLVLFALLLQRMRLMHNKKRDK